MILSRLLVLLAVLILPILTNCSAFPGSTAPVVRIGLVAPFEGRHREIGYDVIYAGRLAIREWNDRGGVQGYRVELVAFDDSGDLEQAEIAARSLALDPMVVGVIGHWLEATTAAGRPIYAKAGLPTIEMYDTELVSSVPSEDLIERYQKVAPFGELPGQRALPTYDACNRLIAAVGESILALGEPTRFGVAEGLAQ
jgi:ABC-type branched-subunit amino acid transport system substrate-binding protein